MGLQEKRKNRYGMVERLSSYHASKASKPRRDLLPYSALLAHLCLAHTASPAKPNYLQVYVVWLKSLLFPQ